MLPPVALRHYRKLRRCGFGPIAARRWTVRAYLRTVTR